MRELAHDLVDAASSEHPDPRSRAASVAEQMRRGLEDGASEQTVSRETIRRVFEDFWLPRLEWAVDCGLLEKDDPLTYTYHLGPRGRPPVGTPTAEWAFGSLDDDGEIGDRLEDAYRRTRNAVGFAPIVETVLAANVALAEAGRPVIGVTRGVERIRSAARTAPPSARLVVDRDGRASSFKLTGEL